MHEAGGCGGGHVLINDVASPLRLTYFVPSKAILLKHPPPVGVSSPTLHVQQRWGRAILGATGMTGTPRA